MTDPHYTDADVTVYAGDCRDVIRDLPDASIDAVVTDPPYELGFMGRSWDRSGVAYDVALWRECLRVLKPGGHLLSFGGTRTAHRLACAVEDAGFELRDTITWLYGQGFPKSLDVGRATADEVWAGWGSALKPASEPIVVARKPFTGTLVANVLEHGTGALNVDGCRVAHASAEDLAASLAKNPGRAGELVTSDTYGANRPQQSVNVEGRWPANVVLTHSPACEFVGQVSVPTDTHYPAARGRGGISVSGHAGQDGLEERTPATERIDAYDCVPGCPVAELDAQSGAVGAAAPVRGTEASSPTASVYGDRGRVPGVFYGDTGGASRFFPTFRWEPKAGTAERPAVEGVGHPTVKPLDLMRWLVRLVVPRGATVLDLFAGSGTTGEACIIEGMRAVLIEQEPTYLPLITARVSKPIEATLDLDVV